MMKPVYPFTNKSYGRGTELINSLGFKFRGQNTKANQTMQAIIFQRTEREIRSAINDLVLQREGIEIQKRYFEALRESRCIVVLSF